MTTTTHEIELEPLAERASGKALLGSVWPFVGSVKVRVCVQVGSTDSTVADLLEMKEGALLALDKLVDEPLDVLVDGRIVARGSLVAVGEHFGVRITETPKAT